MPSGRRPRSSPARRRQRAVGRLGGTQLVGRALQRGDPFALRGRGGRGALAVGLRAPGDEQRRTPAPARARRPPRPAPRRTIGARRLPLRAVNRRTVALRICGRGPEARPRTDPPLGGRTFSPRPGHGRPGRAGDRRPYIPAIAALPRIYVTGSSQPGHGLDRLRRRLRRADGPRSIRTTTTCPVRLGELNTQTRWVLERARRARAGVPAARDAARARRDARATSRRPPTASRCARSAG